jgi:glucose/arabinose dehydrogenase
VFRARSRDAQGNVSPWSEAVVSFGGTVARPAGFNLASVTTSLTAATAMAVAPDGRVFICEQGGALRIVKTGSLLATPFATVTTTATGERGLLGVALDPAFTANGFVYVYYTAATPTTHNRVSRLTANPGSPDVAVPGSEIALIDLPSLSATNHNGGAIHFGPDGKLYVATGENAVPANAPLLTTTLGKILRFNADGTIPTDNPFFASTLGQNQAIWARGLRNPFTFAFQPGTTLMHINDVGQGTWEEVNVGAAGADYGWPSTEGPTSAAGITAPRFAYGHPSAPAGQPGSTGTFLSGAAIVGAAFDAATSPWPAEYRGSFWFGELTGGWVARMHLASGNVSTFATGFPGLRDLAFAGDGSLYVLTATTLQKITHP